MLEANNDPLLVAPEEGGFWTEDLRAASVRGIISPLASPPEDKFDYSRHPRRADRRMGNGTECLSDGLGFVDGGKKPTTIKSRKAKKAPS